MLKHDALLPADLEAGEGVTETLEGRRVRATDSDTTVLRSGKLKLPPLPENTLLAGVEADVNAFRKKQARIRRLLDKQSKVKFSNNTVRRLMGEYGGHKHDELVAKLAKGATRGGRETEDGLEDGDKPLGLPAHPIHKQPAGLELTGRDTIGLSEAQTLEFKIQSFLTMDNPEEMKKMAGVKRINPLTNEEEDGIDFVSDPAPMASSPPPAALSLASHRL